MSATPIADLAFLSDRHSCALVDRAGTVQWLCFPRFDGPAVFARLLDDDAGHWSVQPPRRAPGVVPRARGRRRRPLVGPARGGVPRAPPVRRPLAGPGDDVP